MILILAVTLGLCGAGAFYFFGGGNSAVAADNTHGSSGKTKPNAKDQFEFVEISPLVFPLIDINGAHQIVSLVISIEVKDHEGAEMVNRLTPRLNDAYIQDLYGYLSRNARMHGGIIEVQEVKKRLHHVTSRVIGDNYINDVLLQVVQQRPI